MQTSQQVLPCFFILYKLHILNMLSTGTLPCLYYQPSNKPQTPKINQGFHRLLKKQRKSTCTAAKAKLILHSPVTNTQCVDP